MCGSFLSIFLMEIEANSTAPETEDGEWKGGGGGRSATIQTPIGTNMPLENTGKVKFDPPLVPVIFVLGNWKHYD